MIFSPLAGLANQGFRITQGFGERPGYYKKYNLKGHNGIDLGPPKPGQQGVVIYAAHEGYVHQYDEGDIGYGQYIEIISQGIDGEGERMKSVYGHLQKFLTSNGDYVHANDPIAIMGSTGDSTATHLHFTFKKLDSNGVTLDWNNGFKGAIPIGKYTRLWVRETLS